MQIIKRGGSWDPFRELEELNQHFNQFLGLRRGEGESLSTTDWEPACDVSETEQEYRVHAQLPGIDKDHVQVTLEEGFLTIQGERREEKEEKDRKYHRRETVYGSFLRRFAVPKDADESSLGATFKDGTLDVVIKKTQAKSTVKQIPVH